MEENTEENAGLPSVPDRRSTAALTLLAGYVVWCLGDAANVVVAFSESSFRMGATFFGWKPVWPWIAWGLAAAGAAVCGVRMALGESPDEGRARNAGVVLLALSAARLLSLLDVVGYVFPWLGLIWSPAATWGTALFVVVWSQLCVSGRRIGATAGRVALGVFLLFAAVYGLYGVYFVKTTALHGDEPQYLLITHSLLEDGDIDLSNAVEEDKLDFHSFDFRIHRAPASPTGRLHSTHPVGLPILSLIPYQVGRSLWGHPRLAVVLMQTLLTAVACGLLVLCLQKQGFGLGVSALTSVIVGSSAPMFTQSNQIYPEIHAVLAALYLLIVFPRWPAGDVSVSRFHLVAATAVIVLLPFMHQRHLILSAVLAVPLALTIREKGHAHGDSKIVYTVVGVGLLAHLLYNLHYSGDIWGPFLPGNADRLGPDFLRSIPGQWIDRREGLLRHAPVFLVGLFGLVVLLRSRSRQVGLVAALLTATVGVNTLSTDWTFGFCVPARFMLTGVPALALAMAAGLSALQGRKWPIGVWFVALGFWMGVETITQNAVLPEVGFEGLNLVSRMSERFYPTAIHFVDAVSGETVGAGLIVFWAMAAGGLWLLAGSARASRRGIGLVALAPLLVSHTIPYQGLLDGTFAYQLPRFDQTSDKWYAPELEIPVTPEPIGDGVFVSDMPPLFRGVVRVRPAVEVVSGATGVRGFHTYVNSSGNQGGGGFRNSIPLINSREQAEHTFVTAGSGVSKQYLYTLGPGIRPEDTVWSLKAAPDPVQRVEVFRQDLSHFPEGNPMILTLDGFDAGHYEMTLERSEIGLGEWFERKNDGTVLGVFTAFERVRTDPEGLIKMGERWLKDGWRNPFDPLGYRYFPPQVEARIPYYTELLPSSVNAGAVRFSVSEKSPVHVVIIPDRVARVTGFKVVRVGETAAAGDG